MIKRYTREKLGNIWSEENKYKVWLNVELALVETLTDLGKVPKEALESIKSKAKINIQRIEEIDKEVHHDVIAFLTSLTESIGPEGRFLHLGMTSSDLIDTALAILIKESSKEIDLSLNKLLASLKDKAIRHKDTVCIGRTHGVHGEPTTFGLKMLHFYDDLLRASKRFNLATEEICYGMFSGAVGTHANIDTKVEELTCKKLGLKACPVTTQVISRERHAHYLSELAIIASIIEKIATEIRHLQRTEVLEVEEPFYENQKGSSAMPHKRNPWRSENLCGLARLIRSYSLTFMENITLWHERDISHSSTERIILPDATTLVDFMIDRLTKIIVDLNIYPENMKENMFKFGGVVFSQSVLLKLIEKGIEREKAYKIIQKNALLAWNKKDGDFKKNIILDSEIKNLLSEKEINECFELKRHLINVDEIYKKVFGSNFETSKNLQAPETYSVPA